MSTGPLLSIIGPTATGKTRLALDTTEWLADDYPGFELISADSRQVYRQLPFTSGADIPAGFEQHGRHWQCGSVRLHGLSLITADQDWSVSHFRQLAQQVIGDAWSRQRLPILVGGAGLYHRWALSGDQELGAAPDEQLRRQAEQLSVRQLQTKLGQLDPGRLAAMNHSDRRNPRRLIRAIEQAQAKPDLPAAKTQTTDTDTPPLELTPQPHLQLGLERPLDDLESSIRHRVVERLEAGAVAEVLALVDRYGHSVLRRPAGSTTGVREMLAYAAEEIEYDQLLERWTWRELQYAKRQLSWWRSDEASPTTGRRWFDVTQHDVQTKLRAVIDTLRR